VLFPGAVLQTVKKAYPDFEYITFTRSSSNAQALKDHGYTPLVGTGNSEEDRVVIAQAVANADIILDFADSDDLPLVQSILKALSKSTKKLPIYIHTRWVQ
jgi:hypothetical protein